MAAPTWLTDAQTRWQTALTARLVPTIGIDPGARATGIVVRTGARLLAATIVENPEPATDLGDWAIPVSPEYGYTRLVTDTVRRLMAEHADTASYWWTAQGHTLAVDQSPWLIAVEKINLPRKPRRDETFSAPTVCEAVSVVAPTAVFAAVLHEHGADRVIPALPIHCDTRWEQRHQGTGNPWDYYPAAILGLAGLQRPEDLRGRTLDHPTLRASRVKDLAAAWSVASDAAAEYAQAFERQRRRVLPPAQAPNVIPAIWRERRAGLQRKHGTGKPLDRCVQDVHLAALPAAA